MFTNIEEYILESRETRRAHLDLISECTVIGGGSKEFRGLLAHYLKTTLPSGKKIHLCHACHNGCCSNPKHLYWGTAKDNHADQVENGSAKPFKERMIEKYGPEEYSRIVSASTAKARKVSREVRILTEEQLQIIRERILSIPPNTKGRMKKLVEILGVSGTHVRRYMKRLNIE